MKILEAVEQPVQHRQHLMAKLRLATIRLEDAQQERIWGVIVAAKANASNQKIIAIGLSPHRVRQLRTTDDAQEIHVWLCQLPEHYPLLPSGGSRGLTLVAQLASESLLLVVIHIVVLSLYG